MNHIAVHPLAMRLADRAWLQTAAIANPPARTRTNHFRARRAAWPRWSMAHGGRNSICIDREGHARSMRLPKALVPPCATSLAKWWATLGVPGIAPIGVARRRIRRAAVMGERKGGRVFCWSTSVHRRSLACGTIFL